MLKLPDHSEKYVLHGIMHLVGAYVETQDILLSCLVVSIDGVGSVI
jgi:hypothetical protein